MERWRRGDHVVWRSRPYGLVGYVAPCLIVEDADVIALWQPTGTICKRLSGERGGPRGRNLVAWDGSHEDIRFGGPGNVKLHRPGSAHTVLRSWNSDRARFEGWYVNLEADWTRTPVGFDSWDHILDVEVTDDLECRLKDRDELDWALEQGRVSEDEYRAILAEGERVVEVIAARGWPFSADWLRWRPDPTWEIPRVPAGWDS